MKGPVIATLSNDSAPVRHGYRYPFLAWKVAFITNLKVSLPAFQKCILFWVAMLILEAYLG